MGNKYRQIFTLSLIGALGAGTSIACLSYIGLPLLKTVDPSLFVTIIIQGLCFSFFGFSIGISTVAFLNLWNHLVYVSFFCTLAGFTYGALAVFSVFGSLIGWVAFGLLIAGGFPRNSIKRPWHIGVTFFVLPFLLFILTFWSGGTFIENFQAMLMLTLYPSVAITIVGPISIPWAMATGFFLNCLILILVQFNEIIPEHPAPANQETL